VKARPAAIGYRPRPVLTAALLAAGCAVMLAVDRGTVFLITELLIWVLFAVSVNLLLTYARLISFGQAAYFGLGAYGFALSIWWLDLPLVGGLIAGPVLATVIAFVFGALCVRLTRIYFAMLTLACAQVVFTVIFKWYNVTGGDSGLTGFAPSRLGLPAEWFGILVLAVVVAGIHAMWWMVNAPIGLAIRSVGDNAVRATTLGYSRKFVQLVAFTISGFWAGVAGTLFAAMQGAVFADYADVEVTLDGLIMVILGGLGSFAGPIYGAVVYKLVDTLASQYIAMWELAIGVVLLLVIFMSPAGLDGLVRRMLRRPG